MAINFIKLCNTFIKNKSGSIAPVLAILLVPLVASVGGAIDFARTNHIKVSLQTAADTAVLYATEANDKPYSERYKAAKAIFMKNVGENVSLTKFNLKEISNGHQLSVSATVKSSFLSIIGIKVTAPHAFAEAVKVGGEMELALVLDNTGSMAKNMPTLRKAATDFVNNVMSIEGSGAKIAIVPYVASVNIGNTPVNMGYMDTEGDARYHGAELEARDVTYIRKDLGCSLPWEGGGGGPKAPTGGGSGKPEVGMFFNDNQLLFLGRFIDEIIGIKSAKAADSIPPVGSRSGKTISAAKFGLPADWLYTDDKYCSLQTPLKVNHFKLFESLGVTWKGCVEARNEPFDTNDTPPTKGNSDTLFVPYFWPDEPNKPSIYSNDYLNETPQPNVDYFRNLAGGDNYNIFNLLKYRTSSIKTISEAYPDVKGPNRGCPEPIQPLTDNKNKLLTSISKLQHTNGSGTINSEGLMWGWRVLSPEAPFTEGKGYGKIKKIIVIMSDGKNQISGRNFSGTPDSNALEHLSDYTAYGHWWTIRHHYRIEKHLQPSFTKAGYVNDRFAPIERIPADKSQGTTEAEVMETLNKKQAKACENIKSKGIIIYTILFGENDSTATDLFKKCSSGPAFNFTPKTQDALELSFKQISESIVKLRLTK